MKILNAAQIREADAITIQEEPISSYDLMERASMAFVNRFRTHFPNKHAVHVFCGKGNNGGDGLAIARLLFDLEYTVLVYFFGKEGVSEDNLINFSRLDDTINTILIDKKTTYRFATSDVVVDAIFGIGLNNRISGIYQNTIEALNNTECHKVSVDIASGLFADSESVGNCIFKTELTLSFQTPKLAFFLEDNFAFVGNWEILDIGLNTRYLENAMSRHACLGQYSVKHSMRPREKFSHKGQYGRALIIAGSRGKIGAALLAAGGALRAGVGLLTMHVPSCGYIPVQTALPEAMVKTDVNVDEISHVVDEEDFDVVLVGPGIGQSNITKKALEKVLNSVHKPMVLDADALNIIAANKYYLDLLPKYSILTPHIGEFKRLAGEWNSDFELMDILRRFSERYQLIVVLKRAHTMIAFPDDLIIFNTSGNPGMATGGSGDVLAGIITGLLAQGYTPKSAASIGVYLHGLSADIRVKTLGENSLIASDIVAGLPEAFNKIKSFSGSPYNLCIG